MHEPTTNLHDSTLRITSPPLSYPVVHESHYWPVLRIMRAHRYWHSTSCLVRSSWIFSCPSTEIPCRWQGNRTLLNIYSKNKYNNKPCIITLKCYKCEQVKKESAIMQLTYTLKLLCLSITSLNVFVYLKRTPIDSILYTSNNYPMLHGLKWC